MRAWNFLLYGDCKTNTENSSQEFLAFPFRLIYERHEQQHPSEIAYTLWLRQEGYIHSFCRWKTSSGDWCTAWNYLAVQALWRNSAAQELAQRKAVPESRRPILHETASLSSSRYKTSPLYKPWWVNIVVPSSWNLSKSFYVLSNCSTSILQFLGAKITTVLGDRFAELITPNPLIKHPGHQLGTSDDLQVLRLVRCWYQIFQKWCYDKLVTWHTRCFCFNRDGIAFLHSVWYDALFCL